MELLTIEIYFDISNEFVGRVGAHLLKGSNSILKLGRT